ncbi:NUDIX hydrolase [Pseudoclavibacter helvolus]|uniref:NUDIX hydrolase n=1 Tax=Pseudoclavibacter helvolus TaxID=255205 RepID=UPI003736669F
MTRQTVTACAAVVVAADEHILLVQRTKDPLAGSYSLPGGRLSPGELPERAALRELEEETGLTLTWANFLTHHVYADDRYAYLTAVYSAILPTREILQAGDDAASAVWVPRNVVPTLRTTPLVLLGIHWITSTHSAPQQP